MTNDTPKKKRRGGGDWVPAFLASLAKHANIRAAARAAGIERAKAYDRREQDPVFRKAWDDALENAIDILEEEARQRALGDSDTLMIFLLKSHRPEKYRERHQVQIEGDVEIHIIEEVVSVPAAPGPSAAPPGPEAVPPV